MSIPGYVLFGALLVAAIVPASAVSAQVDARVAATGDDDGPYVRRVGNGLEARWVCGEKVETLLIEAPAWPVRIEPRCGYTRPVLVRPRAIIEQPARITGVPRLVALSDVHGQYDLMVRLLQANGIIDAQGRWSYGTGHLVMTGDVFDRGPQVNEVLWHLYTLEQEAKDAGGALDFTLGNHESLVLRDDLRYLHDKYRRNVERLGTSYPDLYGPDTVLGDWLRSKRTVLQVDELLFLHGGLGPAFFALGLDLDQTNVKSRMSLGLSREQLRADPVLAAMQDGTDSPIWYRGYFMDSTMTKARIAAGLQRLGASRVVVGHTSQRNVQSRFDGLVLAIDSSIKEGESGELLFREDGVLSRGLLDGSRVPVEPGENLPEDVPVPAGENRSGGG